jgi:hypothetical protein
MTSEAMARIKINRMLEKAGWRFFDSPEGPANILLENHIKIILKMDKHINFNKLSQNKPYISKRKQ